MKNWLYVLVLGLTACSSTGNHEQLPSNVEAVVPTVTLATVSQENYPVPLSGQTIEQTGIYKTIETIYDKTGKRVLIPKNAIVSGTYHNDRATCSITWDSVYPNKRAYNQDSSSLPINQVTTPSVCNPLKGVHKGNVVVIGFTRSEIE